MTPTPDAAIPDDGTWRRPAHGAVGLATVLAAGVVAGSGLPVAIALTREFGLTTALTWVLPVAVVVITLGPVAGEVYRRSFRFRITDELVETRFDLVLRSRRTLRRERIRTVDVTANPVLRVLGLAELTAGTGQGDGDTDRVRLVPLNRIDADELRRALLPRAAAPDDPVTGLDAPGAADAESEEAGELICALDWRWGRYAPLSAAAVVVGAAGLVAVVRVADWLGVEWAMAGRVVAMLGPDGLLVAIPAFLLVCVLFGMLGAVVVFAEQWKGYRLVRHREAEVLRVTRGALTTRSVSVDERRLNGITLLEPLGGRRFGATRVDAVAAGIRETERDKATGFRTLLPAAPRPVADRVAAEVLRTTPAPTSSVVLQAHPRAARTKRVWRAAAATALWVAVAGAVGLGFGVTAGAVAAVGTLVVAPVGWAMAGDAYRSLGNGSDARFVVARSGVWSRRTTALRRDDLLCWQLSRSPLQRRAGLVTASMIAPGGVCTVRDVAPDRGVQLLAEASQGVLHQFLEPAPPDR